MEQVRKEFEHFAKLEGFDITRHETGFYLLRSTYLMWRAWLESRELYKTK